MYTDQTTPKGTDLSGSILFLDKNAIKVHKQKSADKKLHKYWKKD